MLRILLSLTMVVLAWVGVGGGTAVVAADETPNLFPPGELSEPGSPPAGWKGDPSGWMLDRFEVAEVDGRRAIRVSQKGSYISATSPLHAGVEAVTMTWEIRHGEFEAGPQPWDVPYLHLRLLDAEGNKVAEKQNRVLDAVDWTSKSVTLRVPEGATQLQVAYGHRLKEGTIEVANIRVSPSTAEAKADLAEELAKNPPKLTADEVEALAKKVPAPDKSVRGASVDETQAMHVIEVPTRAGDLQKAFDEAKQHLQAGEGVKLVLEPGVHRVTRTLSLGELNEAGRLAVLVVESAGRARP